MGMPRRRVLIVEDDDSQRDLKLRVFYWNPDKQFWQWLPSKVDLAARTVSATTRHFSIFQVAGKRKQEQDGSTNARQ